MKSELNRVKNDLDTIQKAMGMAPSLGHEWLEWLKRDKWFSLWWCVPGLIIIAGALAPLDHAQKILGLVCDQWAAVLIIISMLAIAIVHSRKVTDQDGRSESAIREAKRICGLDRQGLTFGLALLVQLAVFFFWGKRYSIDFGAFWSGLFIVTGSTCLVAAFAARVWTLLAWALPFLAYGLCLPFTGGAAKLNGVLFGLMFILVALSFSLIQVMQIRKFESEHAAH